MATDSDQHEVISSEVFGDKSVKVTKHSNGDHHLLTSQTISQDGSETQSILSFKTRVHKAQGRWEAAPTLSWVNIGTRLQDAYTSEVSPEIVSAAQTWHFEELESGFRNFKLRAPRSAPETNGQFVPRISAV